MIFSCPKEAFSAPVGYWPVLGFAYSRSVHPGFPTNFDWDIQTGSYEGVEMLNPTAVDYENWQNQWGYTMTNLGPDDWPESSFSPYKGQNKILWNLTFDFDKLGAYIEPDEDGLYVFVISPKRTIIGLSKLFTNVQIVVAGVDPNKEWLSGEILSIDEESQTIDIRVPKPLSPSHLRKAVAV